METIRLWWTKWPDANIGIATGARSGLLVLDVDPEHGGDDSLDALIEQHGHLPDTVEVLTGGGGRHIYFAYADVGVIGNSVGKLGPGLDVRSDGGYVVAPGSVHVSGITYKWELSSHPDDTALAPPPQWLIDALAATTNDSPRSSDDGGRSDRVDPARVLDGVPKGERNDALFKFASRHRGRGLDIEEALTLALTAAAAADPPLPHAEAVGIVANVYTRYESGDAPGNASLEEATRDGEWERFTIRWGNEIENLPSPEWLIDGIMTRGSFAVQYGPTGVGKSLVVLDQAAAIASGQTWHGHGTFHGPVVYVAAEGVGDLGLRHEALRIGRDLDDLPDLGFVTEAVNLYSDIEVNHLINQVANRRPALIVVDTLARSMDGGDESFAKDMNTVIKNVDRLRRETGSAVMLVHHTGQDKTRERGSSALKGAADVFMKLSGSVTTTATLRCDKMKMAAKFDPISLRFEQKGDSLAVVSRGVAPTLTDHERESLTLVSLESLTHKAWFEAFDEADHGSKSTFNRTLSSLKEKGFVEGGGGTREDQYSITDRGRNALGITGTNGVSGAK